MSVNNWQRRLEDAFTKDGIVGGGLLPVLEGERKCRKFVVSKFHGQMVLGDSFQAFFIDTLQLAESKYRASPLFRTLQWYAYLLLLQLANFRTLRAAEILFVNGRPGQGYGLLRDLKDRALLLGAVGNGFTTLVASSGAGAVAGAKDYLSGAKDSKNKRKRAEAEAFAKMIGSKSKLSATACSDLQIWEELFHLEVHGARVTSICEDEEWTRRGGLLHIIPTPNADTLALYMNRFCEVCWMILRTFATLQLEKEDFGDEWAQKWQMLDDAFRIFVDALGKQGKQIAASVTELIEKSFNFSPKTSAYPRE